ncbi:VPLPA-CTERM sorting domain-containing protein [Litoreibacter roseus]|uniref:VPLPA-CTERM protein sorting domain-containing protein n=1 Tax=Litoreibacter roseus TaxID=2601869 RepID=A0A6N6JCC0_9RHOB|nr:VPLPA-CTERM sorting domain-containing protein [Litoreibacter roseus]GFE63971.1 hypothetical protein KIN_10450 [Litoreibacter roseus]
MFKSFFANFAKYTSIAVGVAVVGAGASAVTYKFDATVMSPGQISEFFTIPGFGTEGTVVLEVLGDDADPLPGNNEASSVFNLSVDIPGVSYSNAEVPTPVLDETAYLTEGFAFSNQGGTLDIGQGDEALTFTSGLGLTFGSEVGSAPTTVGELIAALSAPGAGGAFFASGTAGGGTEFFSLTATLTAIEDSGTGGDGGVSAVPVPASGLLLIAGLGGLALVRHRKD